MTSKSETHDGMCQLSQRAYKSLIKRVTTGYSIFTLLAIGTQLLGIARERSGLLSFRISSHPAQTNKTKTILNR
jgi:hypothetical protein